MLSVRAQVIGLVQVCHNPFQENEIFFVARGHSFLTLFNQDNPLGFEASQNQEVGGRDLPRIIRVQ